MLVSQAEQSSVEVAQYMIAMAFKTFIVLKFIDFSSLTPSKIERLGSFLGAGFGGDVNELHEAYLLQPNPPQMAIA